VASTLVVVASISVFPDGPANEEDGRAMITRNRAENTAVNVRPAEPALFDEAIFPSRNLLRMTGWKRLLI
jgi:hypothetical protein